MKNMLDLIAFNVDISNNALKGKKLPKRVKVLNWGKNETTNGDVYLNDDTLSSFDMYQKKTGRDKDVALDFDHCTVSGSKEYVPGEPKAIAAYGDPELIKDDGLYLNNLEWTPLGEKHARNYKDLSPAAVVDKTGTVLGLDSVGLTPNGAVYGLKFYSANGFDDMIKKTNIKKMNVGDKGGSNAKPTSGGFMINDAEGDLYNKDGANAGVEKVGDNYIAKRPMDANDMSMMDAQNSDDDETVKHDPDDVDCKCASCAKGISALNSNVVVKKEDKKTKAMSANNFPKPDAYKAEEWYNNTMNDSIIKKMASEVGMEGESDAQRVLEAFLAKYEGLQSELTGLINKKANADEGGLKQFSVQIDALKNEVKTLTDVNKSNERKMILDQATRDGKVLTLSAERLQSIDLEVLKDIVVNTKKTVPMGLQLKTMSAQPKTKLSREETVAMFNAQVKGIRA